LAKEGGAAIIVFSRFMLAYELAKGNKKTFKIQPNMDYDNK